MSIQTTVHDLLIEHQRVNAKLLLQCELETKFPEAGSIKQIIEPPAQEMAETIGTFDKDCVRPLTPMLQARFAYAGSWKEAEPGHEWLSLNQIAAAMQGPDVIQRLKDRIEIWWEGTPLKELPWSRITLFGHYFLQGEEIYLIWPEAYGAEPEVISYAGNYEERYPDFEHYLRTMIRAIKECLKEAA